MDEQKKHKITVQIADVPSFKLPVDASEESFYRHIIEQLNNLWMSIRYGGVSSETSEVALAKVALYYAEMYYRKSALLKAQGRMIGDFEKSLDAFLEDFGPVAE